MAKQRKEKSAGVLIARDNPRRYLFMMKRGKLDLPKGKLEKGESEEQAARREVKEETGLNVRLKKGFKKSIRYTYSHRGTKIKKTVAFFLAKTRKSKVQVSKEHTGYLWLKPKEAMKKLHFRNHKNLVKAAEKFRGSEK